VSAIDHHVLLTHVKMNASVTVSSNDDPTVEINPMEEFRAGVTATLKSWSALRAAVEGEWGGAQSQEKAEELRQHLYENFQGTTPKMDMYDLEDNLAIYMEEQFSVVLEDQSERQVADMLYRMHEACVKGDVTLARQAVETAQQTEAIKNAFPVQVQNTDDDDEMDIASESISQAKEYASASLFGTAKKEASKPAQPLRQLGEAPPEQNKVEVDDDGFATVPTSKRRNRK
jgi:pre-rRNA-processing protein TSR2